MKKILILMAVCLLSFVDSNAQDIVLMRSDSLVDVTDVVKKARRQIFKEEALATRSTLKLGTGFNFVALGNFVSNFGVDDEFREKSLNNGFYVPVFLEYGYRVWDHLEVVAGVHYMGDDGYDVYDMNDKLVKRVDDYNLLSVGAYARYTWLNREWVSLYSTLGFWVITSHSFETDGVTGKKDYYSEVYGLPEIVPIGARFGKRFFCFIEPFSISMRGNLMTCGIGFRF